jgi:hypothetical protein
MTKNGVVTISDSSTNGTAFDGGTLRSQESYQTSNQPLVLDFGAGVTVALCFNGEHEQIFQHGHGAPFVFKDKNASGNGASPGSSRQRERRTTTWFNVDAAKLQELQPETNLLAKLRAMVAGLTLPGRVAIAVIALGFCGLVFLIGSMLVSGLRW